MIKRIKNLIQEKISNLNKADLVLTVTTVLVCMLYKNFAENWHSLSFILFFICIKFVFLIIKSIVCKENIDEVHLIKLMFLALIFVFLQMVLFYLKILRLLFLVALCIVILINSGLRVIVLHKLCCKA